MQKNFYNFRFSLDFTAKTPYNRDIKGEQPQYRRKKKKEMKKRTMLKAMNALVKASAKENRWNTGFEYIPARKPVSGSYMRHAMHVARIHQSNDGWIPVVWTPDGMECGVIRESSLFRGTPKFSDKRKYVLVWQDDNKWFVVRRVDTRVDNVYEYCDCDCEE